MSAPVTPAASAPGPATASVNIPLKEETAPGTPVFVIGDVAIDWLAANWRYAPGERAYWRTQPQVQMLAMLSNSWLLESYLLRLGAPNPHTYWCYERPRPGSIHNTHPGTDKVGPRRTADPGDYLHTFTELDLFDKGADDTCDVVCREKCATRCPVSKAVARPASKGAAAGGNLTPEEAKGKAPAKQVYRIKTPPKYYGPEDGGPEGTAGERKPGTAAFTASEAGASAPKKQPGKESLVPTWAPGTPGGLRLASPPAGVPPRPEDELKERVALREAHLNKPRVMVIFDGGEDFRSNPARWDDLIPARQDNNLYVVLYQRNLFPGDPGATEPNALWERLSTHHADRTTVVVSADSLRGRGVNISKSLSWERTALDFVQRLKDSAILKELAKCAQLVVRFGQAGGIHYSRDGTPDQRVALYYDPLHVEGEYRSPDKLGGVNGITVLLAATVARYVADGLAGSGHEKPALREWVDKWCYGGLMNCRALFCHGFGASHEDVLKLENDDLWNYDFRFPCRSAGKHTTEDCVAGSRQGEERSFLAREWAPLDKKPDDKPFWSIIRDVVAPGKTDLEGIAFEIAREGMEKTLRTATPRFPVAKFNEYWVVDHDEIESFRCIRNLLQDHKDKKPTVPLSIAVFGPPGSGKSKSVREIVLSLGSDKQVHFETCNLAEFSIKKPAELFAALLPLRDVAMDGKLPIVFFDEFDSDKLEWLKYFLPMMQDGKFRHDHRSFKIGGAVFVFAGGTSHTYREFYPDKPDQARERELARQKVPDFVSRLRGYVDIRGANASDKEGKDVSIIRRAIYLRDLLERNYRFLIRGDKAYVDDSVLVGLLRFSEYTHGARSMQAVLDMSRLANAPQFDASRLPPVDQLNMHTNGKGEEFLGLVQKYLDEAKKGPQPGTAPDASAGASIDPESV